MPKFVLLEGGGIQRAFCDEGCHHLRRFEYLSGKVCYDAYGDGMILSMVEKVVDTADTVEELERRKKGIMIKKIKLRDMTEDQFVQWKKDGCGGAQCHSCPLRFTNCNLSDDNEYMFYEHKDMFSDKFLDQEVETEVPDVLTPKEREYLEAAIAPFRSGDLRIEKWYCGQPVEFLAIYDANERENPCITIATNGQKFVGITKGDSFTLKELGL